MKINRSVLLTELIDFVQGDNGVVIGIPGIGKTHILSELVINLIGRKTPSCLVRLDALTDGSNSDIAALLGMKKPNWIDQLAAIPIPDKTKGVLIFDAFDAVRDEALKKRILRQIADAKATLPQWSIIASVRTYDALNSPHLIELFPLQKSSDNIHCRKYIIPYLTDEELMQFLSGQQRLNELFKVANERLKQLFRVPFFLSILDLILATSPDEAGRLSVIKSEIELLDTYWVRVVTRVEPTIIAESFLRQLTENMVNERKLSVDKYEYLSGLESAKIVVADQLLSENVLDQQGVQSVKIAYAHNILFDYAVSKLIIKNTGTEINEFLKQDTSRTLFLRPSFVYFFTRLWYNQRELFWEVYKQLSLMNDNNIRMFNKLVPSAVFVTEFEQAEDLPTSIYTSAEDSRVKDIVQGLQYIDSKADKLQRGRILESLSRTLQLQFVGEFAIVLHKLIDSVNSTNEPTVFDICGVAARNLFDYTISQNLKWEQLIAYHAIPMVAITFATNVRESRRRIEQVLSVMESPDFNIRRISIVLDNLQHIYLVDADLVQDIYLRIFRAGELEDRSTTVHSSLMLNFTMSRRDEFNLCRYRLEEFFPTFLAAFPEKAVTLSLELIELFVNKRNRENDFVSDLKFPFHFEINESGANYVPDMSDFWSEYATPKEIELLDKVLEYFSNLTTDYNSSDKLKALIDTFFAHGKSAVSWKRFLSWAVAHANTLHQQLFPVLLQPIILYWSDTIQEAGAFLEAAAPHYTKEQIRQIEEVIHSMKKYVPVKLQRDCENRIIRLLSRIPSEQLQLDSSKEIMANNDPVENSPTVSFTTYSEPYTERMFMSDRGVDVQDTVNSSFMTIQEELDAFCQMYINGFPSPDEYTQLLSKALDVYVSLSTATQLHVDIAEAVLRDVASTCVIALRSDWHAENHGEHRTTNYGLIKEILVACVEKHSSGDIHAEKNYSPGHIYTSTPKSNAAAGLNYLFLLTKDTSLLPAIEKISKDSNPIARFGVTKSIQLLYAVQSDFFWKIMLERLEHEKDNFILGDLVLKLQNKKIYEEEFNLLRQALSVAQPRVGILDVENIFLKNFLLVCLGIYRQTGVENIKQLLDKTLYEHINVAPTFIFNVFEIIQPSNHYRRFDDETDIARSQRLVDLLMQLTNHSETAINQLKANEPLNKDVESGFYILNEIIRRIYFSLQVNDRVFKSSNPPKPTISDQDKTRFYLFVKPLLQKVFGIADSVGFMQPGTAYLFIQILSDTVDLDSEFSLLTIKRINELVAGSVYQYDHSSVSETVKFAKRLLADHRELLAQPNAFTALTDLLNIYAQAGWTEALELLRRLDEIFR